MGLDLQAINAVIPADGLRCKSPSRVLKEVAAYLLAYNLVCAVSLQDHPVMNQRVARKMRQGVFRTLVGRLIIDSKETCAEPGQAVVDCSHRADGGRRSGIG